jgi:hypothetical protein
LITKHIELTVNLASIAAGGPKLLSYRTMMIMMQLMRNADQFPESTMGVALNVIKASIITFKADPLFNLI